MHEKVIYFLSQVWILVLEIIVIILNEVLNLSTLTFILINLLRTDISCFYRAGTSYPGPWLHLEAAACMQMRQVVQSQVPYPANNLNQSMGSLKM